MNELINALEVKALSTSHSAQLAQNELKRSLGQLKAARASFFAAVYETESNDLEMRKVK
jgi:hypothetical protein